MALPQPQFSPKQIAEALRASESSVKRWCDSGTIPTVRTVGGHRRITLEGLQKYLRDSGVTLLDPQVLGLPTLGYCRKLEIPGNRTPEHSDFRTALAHGDESTCRKILRSCVAQFGSRSSAAGELITDAMHGLGSAWKCNEIDVYQERRACDISIRLINELRSELPPVRSDAPIAVGGTPAGDPYQLPTSLVELALREVGWNAISLGSNLPLESFRQAAHDQNPKLVWLSVSAIENLPNFIAEQNRLAGQLSDDITLLVGGRALTDDVRPRLSYTAHCDSLQHLVELAAVLILN